MSVRHAVAACLVLGLLAGTARRVCADELPAAPGGASSTKIKWRAAPQVELGGMLFNTASGDHTINGFVGARLQFRPLYLVTLSGGYGLGIVSQGGNVIHYLNLNHRIYGRADLAWGTANRQFYVGAGPALFLNQFSLNDDNSDYSGMIPGIGAVYGVGYRWVIFGGKIAAAVEFGGQFHHERNDFLVTLLIGPGLKF